MTRRLEPALRDYILGKVANLAEYRTAKTSRDGRALFRLAMISFIGIRETGGPNRGRLVELIQSTLGEAEGESWCMSAVQSGLAFAEVEADIVSPIFASEHCLTVWRNTPKTQRVKAVPLPGAIPIWRHGNTENGHTGCTLTLPVSRIIRMVEANTGRGIGPGGKVERNGDGCYETERSQDGTGEMNIVGFLKPF